MFQFLDNFGRSSLWKSVRENHLKNNKFCAACGRTDNLEVHHIIPYQLDPSKELDPNNLITLCGKYCHFVFGHLMDWKSWNENVIQDSSQYYIQKNNRPYKAEVFGSPQRGKIYETIIIHIYNFGKLIYSFICWHH
jgi:hypothetical protein